METRGPAGLSIFLLVTLFFFLSFFWLDQNEKEKIAKILFNAPIDLFDSFQDGRVNNFAYPRTSLRAWSRVTRGLKLPRMDGGDFVEEKILLLRLDGFFFSFFF